MESLYQFAALISALTWAISGAILKQIKLKRLFSFPFLEGAISLIIVSTIITFVQHWGPLFEENKEVYFFFIIASSLSCIGTVFYIIAIKNNPIGIVFTLCAASTILMTLLLDIIFNDVLYNSKVFSGAILIIFSLFIINFETFKNYENKSLFGIFGGLIAGSIWGIAVIFNDRALVEGNILSAAFTRAVVTVIVLFVASQSFKQKIEFITQKKEILKIIIAGSLITLSSLIWFVSLNATTGSLTTIFGNTAPVFAIVIGFVFLKEKIYRSELLGIALAFIGVMIVLFFKN